MYYMLYKVQMIKVKKVTKQFVTNFDGTYPAKSSYGVFKDLRIKNDLGMVLDKITAYDNGDS